MASGLTGGLTDGNLTDKLSGWGSSLSEKVWGLLDSIFPPEKRAEWIAKAKAFILKNPKVAEFLLFNVSLDGTPLALFIGLSILIFLVALVIALVVGLVIMVLFILTALGFALTVVFPIVFFGTLAVVFFILWGLAGYFFLKWFNKDKKLPPKGDALGDKINGLVGGNLTFLIDNAREGHVERQMGPSHEQWKDPTPAKKANVGTTPRKPKKKAGEDGGGGGSTTSSDAKKQLNGVKGKATSTDAATNGIKGVSDTAKSTGGAGDQAKKVKGAPRKLDSAKGAAKGTVGGATGLT